MSNRQRRLTPRPHLVCAETRFTLGVTGFGLLLVAIALLNPIVALWALVILVATIVL